jgi:hypothetical protein
MPRAFSHARLPSPHSQDSRFRPGPHPFRERRRTACPQRAYFSNNNVEDDGSGGSTPWDCVQEVVSVDELKELTENSSSWRVTVSQNGEIKEKGQKVHFSACNKPCVDSFMKKKIMPRKPHRRRHCVYKAHSHGHFCIICGVFLDFLRTQ